MALKLSTDIHQNEYQRACAGLRQAFDTKPAVRELFYDNIDSTLLELFMIHWCALSAGLTEPIPRFLKRASENCAKLGVREVAEFFLEHAHEEDGHEDWARRDTIKLVKRWNRARPDQPLDADVLLQNKISPAVERYHALHERVINGESPWGELAIDVEIELLSVVYGPLLIQRCIQGMGREVLAELSFLREHVTADVNHTNVNFEVVQRVLDQQPHFAEDLVATAAGALESYADFLGDALARAKSDFARMAPAERAMG
ncbi:MAG: hypothetical protein ACOY0T_28355 [Myxococcota bacterium]